MAAAVNSGVDPRLLARMTGRLGDDKAIEAITRDIGEVAAERLCKRLLDIVALRAELGSIDVSAGTRFDEAAGFDDDCALCEANLDGWAEGVLLACDNTFVIACTERLLGGENAGQGDEARALTQIERDVAAVLLEAFGDALRSTVNPTTGKTECGAVFTGPLKREADLDENDHVATLTLRLEVSGRDYRCRAVLPQHILLKTQVAREETKSPREIRPRWVEQLTQKVHTSNVGLQAYVSLAPISLADTSRLKAGAVLPFRDEKDVRVLLKANGKNLFWCELGRAGERYMLRLRERHGSEEDFIRELTA